MRNRFLALFALLIGGGIAMTGQTPPDPYKSVAEQYVKLVLAVGQHDGDYVDAYYGPPDWRTQAEAGRCRAMQNTPRGFRPAACLDRDCPLRRIRSPATSIVLFVFI